MKSALSSEVIKRIQILVKCLSKQTLTICSMRFWFFFFFLFDQSHGARTAEWGQHLGLLTVRHTASCQPPPLSPSPRAAEQMTGSLEAGTDAVGLHLMMGPLEAFLSANDHSRKMLYILY